MAIHPLRHAALLGSTWLALTGACTGDKDADPTLVPDNSVTDTDRAAPTPIPPDTDLVDTVKTVSPTADTSDTGADGDTAPVVPDTHTGLAPDSGDTATVDTGPTTIVGVWVSEGADLSPLLAATGVTRVDLELDPTGLYTAELTSPAGTTTEVGTWILDTTTAPMGLTMVQTSPFVAALNGVVSVAGGALRIDVVQTTPSVGLTAATAAGGLGSSSLGPDNVETYR